MVCPVTQLHHALVILLQFPHRGVKMWYRKKKEIYGTYGTSGTNDPASSEQANFSVDFATMVMCAKSEGNMGHHPLILVLYVDELFLTGAEHQIARCKREFTSEFEMKDLGLTHYFLGLEVWQRSDGIFLS